MSFCNSVLKDFLLLFRWAQDLVDIVLICNWKLILLNTLRLRQNRSHFADNIFKCIFLNENAWISLKFVPKVRINNFEALVQIMAWHRPGNKPLSEPMVVTLQTHIYVTRAQWVNQIYPESSILWWPNSYYSALEKNYWKTIINFQLC